MPIVFGEVLPSEWKENFSGQPSSQEEEEEGEDDGTDRWHTRAYYAQICFDGTPLYDRVIVPGGISAITDLDEVLESNLRAGKQMNVSNESFDRSGIIR